MSGMVCFVVDHHRHFTCHYCQSCTRLVAAKLCSIKEPENTEMSPSWPVLFSYRNTPAYTNRCTLEFRDHMHPNCRPGALHPARVSEVAEPRR